MSPAPAFRRPRPSSPLVAAGLVVAGLAVASPSAGQVPSNCPAHGVCTDMTYALCIAASCDPDTGVCGVTPTADGWAPCDQAGLDAGSCGPCYVFTGTSCSYDVACAELDPDTLYSTYSEQLLESFGFKWRTCADTGVAFDCMDGVCTATGQTLTVGGQQVPTATCQCRMSQGGHVQVATCSGATCTAVWSTAGLGCASDEECCSGSCVSGRCEEAAPAPPSDGG